MYGLDERREQVFQYVDELNDQVALAKPSLEEWSIMETLEHLYLMEKYIVGLINHAIQHGDVRQSEEKPLHRITDRSYKVQAPEQAVPNGEFTSLSEVKAAMERNREATMFLIHNKEAEVLQNRTFPHPAFGELNLEQWLEFLGWHELRHLDQMKDIQGKLQ
ncbi:hypothetical protein N781_06670 [Pontibacillus halophilus JSM 076056 = DSM 19796]|uniref:DinB-like domain-containing protein n=1 Tax=Pontibacillus halophilus JSM 076056 = DSM 19796 TaxID=1385510 RepID=A0A0A5GFE9_9BACI|nr:DinB family protein [Pontibacillus halophilus]KGX90734.1 hypothetical protein N781_06670 [Pontibacillus halophilus JSM 076056 = DSM 19796]